MKSEGWALEGWGLVCSVAAGALMCIQASAPHGSLLTGFFSFAVGRLMH